MKITFFSLVLAFCSCMNAFSQATSLTVDCQTPGWLSSKINYGDQQTLTNLKVTGYINATDLEFIKDLNINHVLRGVIDLEEVQIAKGGDIMNDNSLSSSLPIFRLTKTIQKFIYPKALVYGPSLPFDAYNSDKVDSVIWTSTNTNYLDIQNGVCGNCNYVSLPEGIESITTIPSDLRIVFPSTIKTVDGLQSSNLTIYSYITNPETVKCQFETYDSSNGHRYWNAIHNSKFYIPKGSKDKYMNSEFATMDSYRYENGNYIRINNGNKFVEVYNIDSTGVVPNMTLYKGESASLEVNIYPDANLVSWINYSSTNSEIVSIDSEGIINANNYGQAEVSATPHVFIEGIETKTGSCLVNVIAHVEGVYMQESMYLHIGEELVLNAKTLPFEITDNKICFESNNLSIATVNEKGVVTGLQKGTCTITATSVDGGYTATCEVTVIQPVESLTMEKHSITLKVGEAERLFAQISPGTANDKTISWHSSNEQIASVDVNGNVIAKKAGEVWIKAISNNNAEAKDSCKVIVSQPVTGIQLDRMTYQLNGIGNSFELKATVTPDDASNKNIKWRSTDEAVCVVSHTQANASVNPNCTITSTGKGTCSIIASTEDGGYTAICVVTVAIPKYKLIYKVDGEVYKTYEIEQGLIITPEPAPTKEGYTFSGWNEIPEMMPTHDVTVTGTFTINKYNLTYNVDGEEYKTVEVEYGKAITPETEPTKDGYVFSGWVELPATMPAKDVTVEGTFSKGEFKLIYLVDDEVYKTMAYDFDDVITPETEPTKDGYTFSGWSEIPATMPAKDVTVIGTFTINKYKLIYNVDGEEYKTVEVEYGKEITPETEPTKDGYSFSGWSEIPATMPAKDVTVEGTFSKEEFNLIYLVDGDVYKTMAYSLGDAITPEAAPKKEGYTFSGWSEIPATMPAEEVTVTGTFTINKYKLTYKVDGEEFKTVEVEYGKAITPETEPTKDGYVFSGWVGLPATMPAKDVTVAGTFSKGAFKLVYLVDGEVYKTMAYSLGDAITPETEPTKDGYTFSGWSEIPATMPANDVTVTGTFTKNAPTTYMLTYKVDGADYKILEVEVGAAITPEKEPTKDGYTFSGWSWIPKKMPDEDVTITGTFTPSTGVETAVGSGRPFDIYTVTGRKVRSQVTSLKGLKKGVYIVEGKKVVVK